MPIRKLCNLLFLVCNLIVIFCKTYTDTHIHTDKSYFHSLLQSFDSILVSTKLCQQTQYKQIHKYLYYTFILHIPSIFTDMSSNYRPYKTVLKLCGQIDFYHYKYFLSKLIDSINKASVGPVTVMRNSLLVVCTLPTASMSCSHGSYAGFKLPYIIGNSVLVFFYFFL